MVDRACESREINHLQIEIENGKVKAFLTPPLGGLDFPHYYKEFCFYYCSDEKLAKLQINLEILKILNFFFKFVNLLKYFKFIKIFKF